MVGRQPQAGGGFQLQDCDWLRGVAEGQNASYQSLTAHAGGGQALATPIRPDAGLIEAQTVATADDSIGLPKAMAGMTKLVVNPTATSANIYVANGSTDTINGVATGTAYALAAGKSALFFCPRDGIWGAILTA